MNKPSRAIDGFVAWCDEFVGNVKDINGVSMPREWAEQLGFLSNAARSEHLNIPDINDDETLCKVLDELKYRIKGGKYRANGRSLTEDFDVLLSQFIKDNGLDWDQHTLASLPKGCEAGHFSACGKPAVVKCKCCSLWLCQEHNSHEGETVEQEAARLTDCEDDQ